MASADNRIGIGIVGCGHVSGVYLKNLARLRATRVLACADLDIDRARARAAEFGVPKACSVEAMLDDPEVEIVLDLTVATAHAAVCAAAVESGKHVFAEKPLCTTRADGAALLERAAKAGVRIGAAPDTFLGAAHQTCRKLIDDGAIGEPVGAAGFLLCHGNEEWHPNPEFFYEAGSGPMIDMGPYLLAAMINLLGPVRSVAGMGRASSRRRVVGSGPKAGNPIAVETATHTAGLIEFANGSVGAIVTSFDVWATELPAMEIYGTEGTIGAPNPKSFGGPVRLRRRGEPAWREVAPTHGFGGDCRGIGVAEMAEAIRSDRPHRASGALAYHVVDALCGLADFSTGGRRYELKSNVDRPAMLPAGHRVDTLDA
jgi:predicted dehydrogenase